MDNKEKVELIKRFLEGTDDQQYITGIENGAYGDNEVYLMIEHPEKGKYLEKQAFKPFLFMKDINKLGIKLYDGNREKIRAAKDYHGIKFTELRTDDEPRLVHGFKYLVTTTKKIHNLQTFFKAGGLDLYNDPSRIFLTCKPFEQFLISTGKRLYKGFNSYNDIHKVFFDIETTGLTPEDCHTFLIGIKDNRGYEKVLSIDPENPLESERQMIIDFFNIIFELKPAIVAGYNSEAFDFHFLVERARILGINFGSKDANGKMVYDCRSSLHPYQPLKRKPATIKFGGETEKYIQTLMWGINVVDISHAVRKQMAIDSDIKSWKLKWICQYDDITKDNRMYIPDGNKIYKIWKENKLYFINKKDNSYKLVPEAHQNNGNKYKEKLKEWVKTEITPDTHPSITKVKEFFNGDPENVDIIRGSAIVFQYLLDDLFETEMVDNKYNQSAFMLGGIAPTSYVRAVTMGNASLWKLLMTTWSYEKQLAIPINERKRDFVGGLSRLLRCGYAKNVLKMDYKSLYPSIQLTWGIFPPFDITGVLESMLTYFRDARIDYQQLSASYKEQGNDVLASLFNIKQLPIKILSNSNFGALSAPEIFPWADVNLGEQITCRGRQYLRLMVSHFMSYGFLPLVLDTDGCNFSIPDDAEDIKYTNKAGDELSGYQAVLAEFNEVYMTGVMKLEEDGVYISTINFSRKNYANLIFDKKKNKYKVKLVGASIKSKTIPTYIEKFLDKGIRLLLDGNGKDFVEAYYDYLKIVYNREIPLLQIASKSKVKNKVATYQHDQATNTNKNGKPLPKQAHMELLIEHGLNPDLGEVIYYVNNGKVKSHGDIGNCYLLDNAEIETNPDKCGEYNVARAVDALNKKVEPLLVCFGDEIRENLLVTDPKKRGYFNDKDLELIGGYPLPPKKKTDNLGQDAITIDDFKYGADGKKFTALGHKNEPLFEMSEPEIKFWNKVRKEPRDIFSDFTTVLSDLPLVDLNDKRYDEQYPKIIDYFKSGGIEIKHPLDYLLEGDVILDYKLDEWQLYKHEYGTLDLLQVIEPDLLESIVN